MQEFSKRIFESITTRAGLLLRQDPGREERRGELDRYLREMLIRYGQLFCGDTQVLSKVKEIIAYLDDPELAKPLKEMRRAKTVRAFEAALHGLC